MSQSGYMNASQSRNSGASLFVGGLAFSATEDDIRRAFDRAGVIRNIRIVVDRETGKPRGFAFIEFDSIEDVDRAVRDFNNVEVCGRSVRLDKAEPGSGGKGKGKGSSAFNSSRDFHSESGGRQNYGGFQSHSGDSGYTSGRTCGPYESEQRMSSGYHSQGSSGYQSNRGYDNNDRQSGRYHSNESNFNRPTTSYHSSRTPYDGDASRGSYPSSGRPYTSTAQSSSHYHNQYDSSGGPSRPYNEGRYSRHQTSPYDSNNNVRNVGDSAYTHRRDNNESSYRYSGVPSSYNAAPPSRERSRSRSLSASSSYRERRQRERQARREKFAQGKNGWDRPPNSSELAQQEAERRAVAHAEAHGKDVTTIRANLVKEGNAWHA